MKKIPLLIAVLLSAFGCASPGHAVSDADTLYRPSYAQRFTVLKRGDTTILSVKDPWQGSEGNEKSYEMTAPYERIISTSTSHLAFLSALECSGSVIGVSGKDYIYGDEYKDAEDIGYDRSLEYEKILSLNPDVMTVYEVSGESAPVFGKLESLGINVVYIADYLEPTPLGRAEWIVAFGALTGRLEEAVEHFRSVEKSYIAIKDSVKPSGKKVILNSPYRDVWYFPGSESYPARLVADAGGEYIGNCYEGAESRPVSMETAYRMLLGADLWLHPSIGTESVKDLESSDARLNNISIPVYNNDKRRTPIGGTDFYQTGVVRPDLILKDLAAIMSGKEDSLHFYRRLY